MPDVPAAIGIGIPMNIDRRTGIALSAANLPLVSLDRRGAGAGALRPARRARERRERDGAGRVALRAARGASDVVALALGTGVGGGLVLDGRLFRGWAEIGHLVVQADGPRCQGNCHGQGTSRRSSRARPLARRPGALGRGRGRPPARAGGRGRRRGRPRGPRADRALPRPRDRLPLERVQPRRRRRRRGLRRGAWRFLEESALDAARREALRPADESLQVVVAELGDDAGLVGAGLVGFEALDGVR